MKKALLILAPRRPRGQVGQCRAEVGLPALQEHIANWGLTWDAEEYKRQLPEIQAKHKQQYESSHPYSIWAA